MIRVFIVEDHPLMKDGIVEALRQAGDIEVAGVAATASEALEKIAEVSPDIALIDIRLPDSDGVSLLDSVKEINSGIKAIMLSISDDYDYVKEAIRGGAQGYLLKDVGSERLVEAVRQVAGGLNVFSPEITATILLMTEAGRAHKPWSQLTSREKEIWKLISLGIPNQDVASQLVITQSTIKFHMRNLFQKLGVRNRAEAVSLAFQSGFLRKRSMDAQSFSEEV